MGDLLRVIMIIIGAALLLGSIISLTKRHMIESYTILWCIVGLVLVVAGIFIAPHQITRYFSNTSIIALTIIGAVGLIGAYAMSTQISGLIRQNREQSMNMAVMGFMIKQLRENGSEDKQEKDTVSE